MTNPRQELAEAEARVERLKQQIAHGTCAEVGHNWVHVGGRNAGCSDSCQCSIPVYGCSKCGDCDYGDNDEANKTIAECAEDDRARAEDEAMMPGGFP